MPEKNKMNVKWVRFKIVWLLVLVNAFVGAFLLAVAEPLTWLLVFAIPFVFVVTEPLVEGDASVIDGRVSGR